MIDSAEKNESENTDLKKY